MAKKLIKSVAAFLGATALLCNTAFSEKYVSINSDTSDYISLEYDKSSEDANSALSDISAKAAILICADTGTVLYAKNEKEHRAIASTTKIMTALLTLEAGELDKSFTVNSDAIKVEGTSMGLRENDIVTRRALCYGMLLPSGNDAANAAAVDVAGSYEEFAKLMNSKAKALGMLNSNFVTPSGLDADNQYSCAYDLAVLTMHALKNPEFKNICSKQSSVVSFGNPPYDRTLYNSNKLLASFEGCIGVKTGFTDNARRTLVSAAERNGVTLIAVTLNAPDDWRDHTRMLDYGFQTVQRRSLRYDCSSVKVDVVGSVRDEVGVYPADSAEIILTDYQLDKLHTKVYLPPFIYADIKKGEVIGEIRYFLNDKVIYRISLCAKADCKPTNQTVDVFTAISGYIRRMMPF